MNLTVTVWQTQLPDFFLHSTSRGVSGYQILGGQSVMRCNVACRRRPVAPSVLPKTGWAIAYPAHPPVTPLTSITITKMGKNQVIVFETLSLLNSFYFKVRMYIQSWSGIRVPIFCLSNQFSMNWCCTPPMVHFANFSCSFVNFELFQILGPFLSNANQWTSKLIIWKPAHNFTIMNYQRISTF